MEPGAGEESAATRGLRVEPSQAKRMSMDNRSLIANPTAEGGGGGPVGSTRTPGWHGHVLVADDSPTNLVFLEAVLRQKGYRVRTVRNGALALEAAEAEAPDLVLLDILMPDGRLRGVPAAQGRREASAGARDLPGALSETLDRKAFDLAA
jgi:hypothetical protein